MKRTYYLSIFILISTMLMAQDIPNEAHRQRALGQAYMEEDEFANAVDAYQQAVALMPQSVSDVINLGLAQYKNDLNAAAIETLNKAVVMDASNPYAHYMLGLAYKKDGQSNEQAIQHFRVAASHPNADAAPVYNLGLMLNKASEFEEAVVWLQKTLELDPEHSAAVYNLAMIAQKQQNRERAMELFKQFQEMKKDEGQKPADAFDESVFAKPIAFDIPVEFQINTASTLKPTLKPNEAWSTRLHEAAGMQSGRLLAVYQNPEDKITHVVIATDKTWLLSFHDNNVEKLELHEKNDWEHGATADYNNDGIMDVLLVQAAAVELISMTKGNAVNVTKQANLPTVGAVDALWVDYDHEGDMDLLLAYPNGDHILQNNGDGTFADMTGKIAGLQLNGSIALAAADLDYDNDIDIVRGRPDCTVEVYSNLRQSTFKKAAERKPHPSGATKLHIETGNIHSPNHISLVLSYKNLSLMDVVELDKDWNWITGLTAVLGPEHTDYWSMPVDINNDGYDDLLDISPQVLFTIRTDNPVMASWKHESKLKNAYPVDWDFDGDLDLAVVYENYETAIIENDGGNQNRSITLSLHGDKNNKLGYGSKIEVKDGLFHTLQEVWNTPVHVGLGERSQVDVIRTTWPNGVFQNVIHATAGQIISVTEKPGYAGSCPFVYAWNGERFEFVSDFLSTGPLGLYLGNGYFPPRSNETVRIRGDQLIEKDGTLELRLTEELREVIYLDQIELLSVDHPSDIELHVNEKFTVPPFPEFALLGMSEHAKPPSKVTDRHGIDVTGLIAENDHKYLRPFERERFDGVGSLHWFEMELDEDMPLEHAMMFMTGYINWADSSIVRHIAQNPEMDFIMPYLQVWNAKGEWETVMNPMGFPAGKLKTIPIDLSGIPFSSPRKLRIAATVQIHWDRIMIDPSPVRQEFDIHQHELLSADFQYGGFSAEYPLAGKGPVWYDYTQRASNPKWDYQRGDYTRYGNVHELLEKFDDRYVIMETGGEVAVQFDAKPLQPGMQRTYLMRAHGWVKDLDHSTAISQTVEPLPFQAMSAYPYRDDEIYPYADNVDYLEEYNTRAITNPIEPLIIPKKY